MLEGQKLQRQSPKVFILLIVLLPFIRLSEYDEFYTYYITPLTWQFLPYTFTFPLPERLQNAYNDTVQVASTSVLHE